MFYIYFKFIFDIYYDLFCSFTIIFSMHLV